MAKKHRKMLRLNNLYIKHPKGFLYMKRLALMMYRLLILNAKINKVLRLVAVGFAALQNLHPCNTPTT